MPSPAVLLCFCNLAVLGALPKFFFRRGERNLRWWATTAPFVLSGLGLLLPNSAWSLPASVGTPAVVAATLLAACSLLLMGMTLGTHTAPPALWHQDDVMPQVLITRGPYAAVRHPFYTSYLLNLAAACCAVPSPITAAALA